MKRHASVNSVRAAAFSLALLLGAAEAQAMSLRDAVTIALATNPVVKSAENEREAADHDVDAAWGQWLPKVAFSYELKQEQLNQPTTRLLHNEYDFFEHREGSATITQLVFDGFGVHNQVRTAKARMRSAAYTVDSAAEGTALNVIGAYLEVMRRRRTIGLAEANLDVHRHIREMIRLRMVGGVSRRSDFDQSDSRLALAVANLRQEQSSLEDAEAAFVKLVGQPPDDRLSVPPRPERPVLPGLWGEASRGAARPSPAWAGTTPGASEAPVTGSEAPAAGAPSMASAVGRPATACEGMPDAPVNLPLPPPPPAEGAPPAPAEGAAPTHVAPAEIAALQAMARPAPDCPENKGQDPTTRAAAAELLALIRKTAVDDHPSVRAARADTDAAKAQVGVAEAAYAPRIDLRVEGTNSEDRVRDDFQDYAAGVTASWTLFNGLSDRARVQAAEARLERAKSERDRIERLVAENLEQSANALLTARDRTRQLERYVDAIASAQAAYLRQYAVGQRSLLDLVNAQDEQYSARYQMVTAELTETFAVYRLYGAMGQLLEAVEVPAPEAAYTRRRAEAGR